MAPPKGHRPWNKGKKCPNISESKKGYKHTEEAKTKIGLKSLEFWTRSDYIAKNKFPREKRKCICGCEQLFECRFDSKQKFIHGHNSRIATFNNCSNSKGKRPWNKGIKETRTEILQKQSKSHKGLNKGSKCNFWEGGITPLHSAIRKLFEYKQWRKEIFERDSYKCQKCFRTNCYLIAHHIEEFSKILKIFLKKYNWFSPIKDKEPLIELAINHKPFWNIKNGITYCDICHDLTKGGRPC